MKLILNASPMIHLTKAGYSWILKKLKKVVNEIVIPEEVYVDVVINGKEKGALDAYMIEKLVENKIITVIKLKDKKFFNFVKNAATNFKQPLHEGEAATIALAKEKNGVAIIDEAIGREIAKVMDVKTRGSVYLFILLYKRKLVKKKLVIQAFEDMIKSGYRLSPKDYEIVKKELEKL
ncbi:MAG: DUF3368 domain-containing protein [Euryarchaeota archaeon]|nr:DUF3368 domain-containing protein [Euryarchaeota archaeon]